ncbi:C-type lectin domain family 14 member A [Denticeps clupeoides]|uniref:C-type lectin domain family 14 member A n=1 Tax=Denticeps clupeoides TaxID=299321 RepID=UPI0010A32327|nr:C-type lectin domain family 14 member A-like [Denticeps clupeoides]
MDYWMFFLGLLNAVSCFPRTPYIVHFAAETFNDALSICGKNGFLTTLESDDEVAKVLNSISQHVKSSAESNYWIGLRKPKRDCVIQGEKLKGFSWTENNTASTADLKWKVPPQATCTHERCAYLSVNFDGTSEVKWGLADAKCTAKFPFICRALRERQACPKPSIPSIHDIIYKDDPDTVEVSCPSGERHTLTCSPETEKWLREGGSQDLSSLCRPCPPGYILGTSGRCEDVDECASSPCRGDPCVNSPGSYECKAAPGPDPPATGGSSDSLNRKDAGVDSPPDRNPSQGPEAEEEAEERKSDYSQIIIPIIIAALALVVLLVIIVVVVTCCRRKKHSKNLAGKKSDSSKESMGLKDTDNMEKVNK